MIIPATDPEESNAIHADITYSVRETRITYTEASGKQPETVDLAADHNGYITNTPTTEIRVSKEWQDNEGNSLTGNNIPAGAEVTFGVFAGSSGEPVRTATLNGLADIAEGPAQEGQEIKTEEVAAGAYERSAWEAFFTNLPVYDTEGNLISYTVKETLGYSGFENQEPDGVEDGEAIINKELDIDIHILKVNAKNKSQRLTGAGFVLKKFGNSSYTNPSVKTWPEQTVSSEAGKEGTLTFEGLTSGYYELQETRTPAGFIRSGSGPIRFRVEATGDPLNQLQVVFSDSSGMVTYNAADGTFTVGNKPGVALPNTGGPGSAGCTLAGLLMILLGGGVLAGRKRKALRERGRN